VLGVSGGIAAYKAVELLRVLTESGHDVTVVPTAAALQFVGAPTWAALSHHPVATDVWTAAHDVAHVQLGRHAELVVVAPATADLLARAAHGLADDLLTNVLLTARCPVLFVPAMHTEMWEHPATVENVATLRRRGAVVLEPASGRLTGTDTGKGRLPEPAEIAQLAELLLYRPDALPTDLVLVALALAIWGEAEWYDWLILSVGAAIAALTPVPIPTVAGVLTVGWILLRAGGVGGAGGPARRGAASAAGAKETTST